MPISIATYTPADFDGVDRLWRIVFPDDPPWNAAASAVPAKLAVQPELFLVALETGSDPQGQTPSHVIGSIMAGYDGHRGWLYALAVDPDQRRRGIAKLLVEEALKHLRTLGCTKVNLQVRAGNETATAFWRGMGFAIEERVSMGRRL
jgi:ribosomal protein S18 acetylase RimI-like enzyme